MAGFIPVADRAFLFLQHVQFEQRDHAAIDPHVVRCEMTHDRSFKMPQFAGWMIDSAIIDDGSIYGLDRGLAECPATTETPTDGR